MFTVSFRAKRGTSQELFDRTNDNARSFICAQPFSTPELQNLRLRDASPRKRSGLGDDRLERPAKVLEAVQTFFDYVQAGGVAEPDGAVVTEGSSRNYGNAGFTQQTVGEILRRQPQLADVHQHVMRPAV